MFFWAAHREMRCVCVRALSWCRRGRVRGRGRGGAHREMRPLFFWAARPMKEEWKMRPYLGVLPCEGWAQK